MSKQSRKDRKTQGAHVRPKAPQRPARQASASPSSQPSAETSEASTSSRVTASGSTAAPSTVRAERRQQREEQAKRQRTIRMAATIAIAVVVLLGAWGAYRWYMGPDVSADVVTYFDVETANALHPNEDIVILYEQIPPVGGPHNAAWQTCGYYEEYVYNWHGVHSMEHGAVWITYDPELPQDQIDTLRGKADQGYVLVSPYPGMDAPVVASVWGKQIQLDGADDERLDAFIKQYRLNADNTPEPGASCNGGATWTTDEVPQQEPYVQPAGAEATPIGGLTSMEATATAEASGGMSSKRDSGSGTMAGRVGVVGIIVVALAVIGVPLAIVMANADPDADSPEVGFLRDMIVHHDQAVEMSLIVRDRSDDEQLDFLATDIMLAQQSQIGMMNGWLQLWDASPNLDGPAMAWMGHEVDGPMPGMATSEELEQLRTLPADEAEVLFLQLMIAHHQSAVDMAEAYLERGDQDDVEAFARNIIMVQDLEIDALTAMLEQRGAGTTPVPPDGTPDASPVASPAHEGH